MKFSALQQPADLLKLVLFCFVFFCFVLFCLFVCLFVSAQVIFKEDNSAEVIL